MHIQHHVKYLCKHQKPGGQPDPQMTGSRFSSTSVLEHREIPPTHDQKRKARIEGEGMTQEIWTDWTNSQKNPKRPQMAPQLDPPEEGRAV